MERNNKIYTQKGGMEMIGLIDVDGHNYPNLALMKLSAWHKQQGDTVKWYDPLFDSIGEPFDRVYMSKVFSFSPDFRYGINAKEVVRSGTGYAISLVDGREVYDKSKDSPLPIGVEHTCPDYSIYPELTKDTAYGFLTRGCPRGCDFCHVSAKEGKKSYKVADLSEFWSGQKKIELLDPNTLACPEWKDCLQQLIDSKASVNFNQGLDIRMMTEEKAEMLAEIKTYAIHFAWDRFEDKDIIQPKFLEFRKRSKIHSHNLQVYVLCGDREKRVLPQDIERIKWLRDNGFAPYVTIYDKDKPPSGHELRKLQRWVNNRYVFWSCDSFEDYQRKEQK